MNTHPYRLPWQPPVIPTESFWWKVSIVGACGYLFCLSFLVTSLCLKAADLIDYTSIVFQIGYLFWLFFAFVMIRGAEKEREYRIKAKTEQWNRCLP